MVVVGKIWSEKKWEIKIASTSLHSPLLSPKNLGSSNQISAKARSSIEYVHRGEIHFENNRGQALPRKTSL